MPERAGLLGWSVSLGLHASIVGAGFLLVWTIVPDEDEPYATDATRVVFRDAGMTAPPDVSPPVPSGADPLAQLFEARPDPVALTPVDAPPVLTPPERSLPPAPDLDRVLPEMTIERDAAFFGSGASDARRIVYIVDASGSTIALFPAIARELGRSLHALNATQHGAVIAALGVPASESREASAVTRAHPEDGFVRTTRRGVERLSDWFGREVRPSGRADLLDAIERALALEPDAIFLLAAPDNASLRTEGVLEALDRLNPIDERTGRRRAIIGVVAIGAPGPNDPLVRIAQTHGAGAGLVALDRSALLEAP